MQICMEIFVWICINIITYKKRFQKKFDIWPKARVEDPDMGYTFASL